MKKFWPLLPKLLKVDILLLFNGNDKILGVLRPLVNTRQQAAPYIIRSSNNRMPSINYNSTNSLNRPQLRIITPQNNVINSSTNSPQPRVLMRGRTPSEIYKTKILIPNGKISKTLSPSTSKSNAVKKFFYTMF